AWEKIINGASLLQAYAGFVFEGPGLTKEIVKGLRKKLQNTEYKTLEDAIGSAVSLE
ncbi:MAG: dihydroorotate dehydrogenase (quinone), partial [Candidatus Poseidoniales archaeon]